MSDKLTDAEIKELQAKKVQIAEDLQDRVEALFTYEVEYEVEGWDITKPAELKQLLESMCDRMNRIEYGDDYLS